MHSSRMRAAGSLTVSHSIWWGVCMPCTPPAMHAPRPCMPPTMHAPCHAHPHHACPFHACPFPCHACPLPCMPHHTPCHACPLPHAPPAMHVPCHGHPLPCMPPYHAYRPTMHAPCGQTDTCKNITFANFVCQW